MFFGKKDPNLELAQRLVKDVGIEETLDLLKEKRRGPNADPGQELTLILALGTCNLSQTMKAEFIAEKIDPDTQLEITEGYVAESLRKQKLLRLGKAEIAGKQLMVMEIVGELLKFWRPGENPAEAGPGPRYYCVKEILRRLGGETNYDLHDALFEMMYLQHKRFIDFFKDHLGKAS